MDRSAKKHLGMLSAEGGVEIETVAEENPDAIAKIWIDPTKGLDLETATQWVSSANLPEKEDSVMDERVLAQKTKANKTETCENL